jgi:hypothetical protein
MLDPTVTAGHAPPPTTDKLLRQFSLIWVSFFAALALWHGLKPGNGRWAVVFATLALTLGPLGLIRPAIIRPVFVVWMAIALPIGAVISRLVLALLYYLLFTPLSVFFTLIGRDALRLRRPQVDSYWVAKPQAKDVREYLRLS